MVSVAWSLSTADMAFLRVAGLALPTNAPRAQLVLDDNGSLSLLSLRERRLGRRLKGIGQG
jgi:hypothetical protein